jgi:plastocyanin
MRKLLVCLLSLAAVAAFGSQAVARPHRSVTVGDDFFVHKGKPATITVKKGTKVTWNWSGKSMHNVDASKGPRHFRSSIKKRGSFSKILTKPGTYTIFCDVHAPSMRMKIRVVR